MAKSKQDNDSKKKKGFNPKSLCNLKPVKKGERSRNPLGGKAHNPLTRALTLYTTEAYCKALSFAFSASPEELQKYVDTPGLPMLEKFVANSILKAYEKDDFRFVERIANRLVGRVGENLVITNNTQVNMSAQVATLTDTDFRDRIKKIDSDV